MFSCCCRETYVVDGRVPQEIHELCNSILAGDLPKPLSISVHGEFRKEYAKGLRNAIRGLSPDLHVGYYTDPEKLDISCNVAIYCTKERIDGLNVDVFVPTARSSVVHCLRGGSRVQTSVTMLSA